MSEENEAFILRFVAEVWNKGNLDAIDELLAPDFAFHSGPDGLPPGREGCKVYMGMNQNTLSDLEMRVEDLIAEADQVASRVVIKGTHTGELMGIPATGKQITLKAIAVYRLASGKISDFRVEGDQLGMMQQMGVIPSARG
jgi:steroid delta-isomerase-like uncharacterized protein